MNNPAIRPSGQMGPVAYPKLIPKLITPRLGPSGVTAKVTAKVTTPQLEARFPAVLRHSGRSRKTRRTVNRVNCHPRRGGLARIGL